MSAAYIGYIGGIREWIVDLSYYFGAISLYVSSRG